MPLRAHRQTRKTSKDIGLCGVVLRRRSKFLHARSFCLLGYTFSFARLFGQCSNSSNYNEAFNLHLTFTTVLNFWLASKTKTEKHSFPSNIYNTSLKKKNKASSWIYFFSKGIGTCLFFYWTWICHTFLSRFLGKQRCNDEFLLANLRCMCENLMRMKTYRFGVWVLLVSRQRGGFSVLAFIWSEKNWLVPTRPTRIP